MSNYLNESFKKFKTDALAKGVYDLLKWLVRALLVILLSYLIPAGTSFSNIVTYPFYVSVSVALFYTIIIIIIVVIATYLHFRKKYKEVELDNFTDEVTTLKNHKALKKNLVNLLKEADKLGRPLSLIIIDINDFKQFYADNGSAIAEQILKNMGTLLGNDKSVTDEAFRFCNNGCEFLIVANNTSANDAFQTAERKRKLIERTNFGVDNNSYSLKVSCGVTVNKKGDNIQSFINRGLSALQAAKDEKGNCSKLFV